MRRLSLMVGILLLTACTDTDSRTAVAPDDITLRAQSHADEVVPVHWSYHVAPQGTDMVPCQTAAGDPVILPGGVPLMVNELWVMTGHVSYIEALDEAESWARFQGCTATFTGGELTALSAPTAIHLEGPQGDALDLEGLLVFDMTIGVGVAHWTITGGEGAFAGAEGFIDTREYPAGPEGAGTYGIGDGMMTRPAEIDGRPMKLDFTFVPDYSQGTCDIALPDGSVIPLPYVLRGSGQASHMGRGTATITHEWCRIDPARGIVSGGTFETVGANGDRVTGVWDGYTFEDQSFALTGWLDDGTGRFAGAYGELDIRGVSDPFEGGWYRAEGRITY